MRRFMLWLWKHTTVEVLAVAVFLTVAGVLWWGMPPRPEQVITFSTDGYHPGAFLISPDGTLCLVQESLDRDYGPFSSVHGLRVFDLTTGQEVWQWYSTVKPIQQLTWTKQNRLFLFVPHATPIHGSYLLGERGQVLGFDPRQGKEPFFRHQNPHARATKFSLAANGDTLLIRHLLENSTPRFERVDLRSGAITTFVLPISEYWSGHDLFSPDGTTVLYWRPHQDKVKLELYDIPSGKLLQQFPTTCKLHTYYCAAFSPDGRLLAACENADGLPDRVRVWEVHTGKLVATLEELRTRVVTYGAKKEMGFICVNDLRFLGNGSLLWVDIGGMAYDPQGNGCEGFGRSVRGSRYQVFDTQTFQRLDVAAMQFSVCVSPDGRFVSTRGVRDGDWGVILSGLLAQHDEAFYPCPWSNADHFGFADTATGMMHYVMAVESKATPRKDSSWVLWARGWAGLSNEEPPHCDLTLRRLPEGQVSDRLTFPVADASITPIPGRDQLLVHLRLGDGQDRLEVYSLPLRRPWWHSLGWAFVAGISIELPGLAWRRLRRKKPLPVT